MKKLLFILSLLGLTAFVAPAAQARDHDRDYRHHGYDRHRSHGYHHDGYYRHYRHYGGRRFYYRHGRRYYYSDYGYPGYYGPAYGSGVSVNLGF